MLYSFRRASHCTSLPPFQVLGDSFVSPLLLMSMVLPKDMLQEYTGFQSLVTTNWKLVLFFIPEFTAIWVIILMTKQ